MDIYTTANKGLKMIQWKTKVVMEKDTPIYVNNTQIEMGQGYCTRDKNQDKEIQRRITAGWTCDIYKGNTGTCLKRQVYNSCLFPAMTYGGNMGTRHPSKEQVAACTNEDGKENMKHDIPGEKSKYLGKRNDKGHTHD